MFGRHFIPTNCVGEQIPVYRRIHCQGHWLSSFIGVRYQSPQGLHKPEIVERADIVLLEAPEGVLEVAMRIPIFPHREFRKKFPATPSQLRNRRSQSQTSYKGFIMSQQIVISRFYAMADSDHSEQAIGSADPFDERFNGLGPRKLFKGPDRPWIKGIVACSVSDVGDSGQESSI